MRARDLIRRLVPRWLNARQALALSNLCMTASEAVWDVHEDKMQRLFTKRILEEEPRWELLDGDTPGSCLDDLPF